MGSKLSLPSATRWESNPYEQEWGERDYLYVRGGPKEVPNHACKGTYRLSKPFITSYRNAVDIGCRDGEFSRYLHLDFAHVYAFDPRRTWRFPFNVDLKNVTHFQCALGSEVGEIEMFKGSHVPHGEVPARTVRVFTLDMFDLKDVDYIKMDVEGFEKKVLLGAARTIERYSPLIVLEQNDAVIEGETRYSAKLYLESIGYRQVAVDKRGWDFVMARSGRLVEP